MIRRSIAFSWLERQGQLVIQLASLVILARLISPEDYGVFATGAAIATFISLLSQFGQTDYLSQEPDLTRQRRSAALGACLSVWSGCVATVVVVLALLPADTVGANLDIIIIVLAVSLGFEVWSQSVTGVIQRELQFDKIFFFGVTRQLAGTLVSISLAALGAGAMSLALGMAANRFAGFCLALSYGRLVGHVWPRFRSWGPVFRFGKFHTAVRFLVELRQSGTVLAVSQLLGFAAAGLLSRSERINLLVHQAVTQGVGPVIVPALARQKRAGRDLKQAYYLKLSHLSALAWPFAVFTAVFAEPMVWLVLGPNWGEAAPLVRILSIIGVFAPFTSFNEKFYVVLDCLPVLFRRQLIIQLASLGLIILAALWSLQWVAFAIVCERALKVALTVGPVHHNLGCDLKMTLRALKDSAITTAAIAGGISILIAIAGVPESNDVIMLFAAAAMTAVIWLTGLFALRHPVTLEVKRIRGRIRGSGRASA